MDVAQDAGHIEVYEELEKFVKRAGLRIQESVQRSESESNQQIKVGVTQLDMHSAMGRGNACVGIRQRGTRIDMCFFMLCRKKCHWPVKLQ